MRRDLDASELRERDCAPLCAHPVRLCIAVGSGRMSIFSTLGAFDISSKISKILVI